MESTEAKKDEAITFDDFLKVDIRAGLIESAEPVPKSTKLLKLQVDFGDLGKRQILAGIAMRYQPDMIVGKRAAFVVNLAPRMMMGLESHGMILAGENGDPDDPSYIHVAILAPSIKNGARLG
jgi:methionyl-tRNA synthetase